MPYPSAAEIDSLATRWNIDDIIIFAFAAEHARLPVQPQDIRNYLLAIEDRRIRMFGPTELQLARAQPVMFYAYAQDNGGPPTSKDSLRAYLKTMGIIDENGNLIRYPIAGEGYPPGSVSGIVPPEPDGKEPPTEPSFDFGSLLTDAKLWAMGHPLESAGIAVGLYWYMGGKLPLLGKRRR